MLLLVISLAFGLPAQTSTWKPLQASPVKIDCTETAAGPYCRSTGVIGAPLETAVLTFEKLDQHVAQMGSISTIERLESDVLRIVMNYPYPIPDRDYVARFDHRVDPDGSHVFVWSPIQHARAPIDPDIVRLDRLDGEWRFKSEGDQTRVTYLWQADPGGRLPDANIFRKKAGQYAIDDMAKATGSQRISP